MENLRSDVSLDLSMATAAAVVGILAMVEVWVGLQFLHRVSLSLPGIVHAFLTAAL